MSPVWVAMGLSFQTVKKWLHDRGEPSCSGGWRGQVNCVGLRAGAKPRPPPLNIVRFTGDWELWIEFFADAVVDTATQAVDTAQRLMQLTSEDGTRINKLGRVAGSVHQVHRTLLERPIASSNWLQEKTQLSPATINTCLKQLEGISIVSELTGRKRNRLYSYYRYIDVMNQGTEPPS